MTDDRSRGVRGKGREKKFERCISEKLRGKIA